MYADALLYLSGAQVAGTTTFAAQTVTGAVAVISTNTIDLGVARDIGQGNNLYARMQVGVVFAGLTALLVEVIVASDAALTTNIAVVGSSGAIPVASLVANSRFAVQINPILAGKGQRYMGVRYTPTGTGTTGSVTTDIGTDFQDGAKFYATGIAVI